jgi:hypothetical protein
MPALRASTSRDFYPCGFRGDPVAIAPGTDLIAACELDTNYFFGHIT